MIRGTLLLAMDFTRNKNAPTERYSYRRGTVWYYVNAGPRHSNTYRVTGFDEAGLADLVRWERSAESVPLEGDLPDRLREFAGDPATDQQDPPAKV